jgi:hypothetical protein
VQQALSSGELAGLVSRQQQEDVQHSDRISLSGRQ